MRIAKRILTAALPALVSAMAFGVPAHAFIDGLTGPTFNLTATTGYVFTSNATTGGVPNLLVWGYTSGGAEAQLPGPTLIVTQGQQVTIHLTNLLPEEASIVVPGFKVATGTPLVFPNGVRGAINSAVPAAAANGGTQTYTFTADRPGTFYYHSGTNQAFQVRMGLFGALIVRPAAAVSIAEVLPPGLNPATPPKTFTKSAYTPGNASDDSTAYDREFLYMVSEMDSLLNGFISDPARTVPPGFDLAIANNDYFFVNGRESFDIMLGPDDPHAPQPAVQLPAGLPPRRAGPHPADQHGEPAPPDSYPWTTRAGHRQGRKRPDQQPHRRRRGGPGPPGFFRQHPAGADRGRHLHVYGSGARLRHVRPYIGRRPVAAV